MLSYQSGRSLVPRGIRWLAVGCGDPQNDSSRHGSKPLDIVVHYLPIYVIYGSSLVYMVCIGRIWFLLQAGIRGIILTMR